ncbi:unnamed protein product [Tuber melanosporum]|uniref:(Perigord truffle) hypothetical protein n=1 Tax=Tuber melanosporum (strain Mel28) TaxID=656061 RepID=D5G7K4_TUBMM|nr:uncharacterized protein GSTUM_00004594001 [Tuber melanosporum]CAZ80497.1 unnamed protein product [Tuber melanosporum]
MAQGSTWEASALLPPAPFPCGYFWDTEEIRHQEHLHRVSHAQFLYSHRTDSPEAMRVYRDFISEQNAWMAVQEELREREAQMAMKAQVDRASRWAEEWRRLESGEAVEDVLMKTGATLVTKSPFGPEHTVTCVDIGSILLDEKSTPKGIRTVNLPESLIDQEQGRNWCDELPRFKSSCAIGHFPGFDQADGTTAAMILGSVPDPAESTQKLKQNLNQLVQSEPQEQDGRSSSVGTHSRENGFVAKPNISFSGLGPPAKSEAENFDTSKLPSAITKLTRQNTGLAGGEVLKICSHKRWTYGGDLLYEVLWKPHDLNTPPLMLWVKSGDFMDASHRVILDEYRFQNKLGIVHWRSQGKKRLRTSGSLGVKEIKGALDERKRLLIATGRYDDRAAELLGKCRWMMRGEWQQRGRGWAAAIEVVERWKKAWRVVDEAERQICHNLEREPMLGVVGDACKNDIPCLEEVGSKDAPSPPVVHIDRSPGFKQLDGGHAIDPERDHDPQRDNYGVAGKDVEWKSFFGGIDRSDPMIVDDTNSSTIGGISELGGITRTFPKAVETWRIGYSESLTPEVRGINKTKGGFINLLRQDRFTRKSISEATSTPVSVQSVSEAGSCLAHERETFLSRPFIKDRHQDNTMDAATAAAYKPILQPSELMEGPASMSRTPTTVRTPLDGETGEACLKSRNGMSQLNCTAIEDGRGEVRSQGVITRGAPLRDVAIQASPSLKSLARLRIEHSGVSSSRTKTIREQLDHWCMRFLELISQSPGLSSLLAGAKTHTDGGGSTQALEYARRPVVSFEGDGGHMPSLYGERGVEGDQGGNTEQGKGSGPNRKKHGGEFGAEGDRDRDPLRRVTFPQELASPQDGVSLYLGEIWGQEEPSSPQESLVQGAAPIEEEAPTKQDLAMQGMGDGYERAKARGKELRGKKREEGLTREERKEYMKLKQLLVKYRVTRWFSRRVDIPIELHMQRQQHVWGASLELCETS